GEEGGEGGAAVGMVEVWEPYVGLQILAVGDHATVGDLPDQQLYHRMIGAHHGEAVKRHIFDEGTKRLLHRLEGLEMIEMLRVHVGDDGDVGRKLEEGAVGF